jgi:hypothetical protein
MFAALPDALFAFAIAASACTLPDRPETREVRLDICEQAIDLAPAAARAATQEQQP